MTPTVSHLQDESREPVVQGERAHKASTCAHEQCVAKAASVLALALASTGITRQVAASSVGVSTRMIDRWTDPSDGRSISLARVLRLAASSTRGREAARIILTSALANIELPTSDTCQGPTLRERVDDLHALVGEFSIAWRDAVRDGHIDDTERKHLLKRVQACIAACERIQSDPGGLHVVR